jgi:hypothetical protein
LRKNYVEFHGLRAIGAREWKREERKVAKAQRRRDAETQRRGSGGEEEPGGRKLNRWEIPTGNG